MKTTNLSSPLQGHQMLFPEKALFKPFSNQTSKLLIKKPANYKILFPILQYPLF